MRDFYGVVLPLVAVVFLIFYILLIDPHVLTELGWWLQDFSIWSVVRQTFLKFPTFVFPRLTSLRLCILGHREAAGI